MNLKKSPGMRRWIWLIGGIFLLLLLAAFIYGTQWSPSGAFAVPDSGIHSLQPIEFELAPSSVPEIDMSELSSSLLHVLDSSLKEWDQRNLESLEENQRAQRRIFEEWRTWLDGRVEEDLAGLQEMDKRLSVLEHGMSHLLASLEDEEFQASMAPAFTFRGIEMWHGRPYALLEHQGQILPVRQGESRLGWRIHAIDRIGRKLRVSDGTTELVLEEQ